MSKRTRVSHPIYNLLPTELEGFDPLAALRHVGDPLEAGHILWQR